MARCTKRPPLVLIPAKGVELKRIAGSLSEPLRRVRRAKILLGYSQGKSITEIATKEGISRDSFYKWVERALAMVPMSALDDKYHRPLEPTITPKAKVWVIDLACTKPKEIGYAAELWTIKALAEHVRSVGPKEGYDCLKRAAKATVWRILNQREIKPHKIKYYIERKDPEFESKQEEVLMVYREVSMLNAWNFDPFKEAGIASIVRHLKVRLEIVKRSDDVKGFKILPKRWIVERTFGWLIQSRRLVRDYEAFPLHSESMIYLSISKRMLRRITV
jgi:transposase